MLRLIFPLILVLTVLHGEHSHAFGPGYTRVNATAESAETAYTNPAGMTRFDQKTTSAGVTFIKSFKEFNVDESPPPTGEKGLLTSAVLE